MGGRAPGAPPPRSANGDSASVHPGLPPPPPEQTPAYGQRAAGTHPTGMHHFSHYYLFHEVQFKFAFFGTMGKRAAAIMRRMTSYQHDHFKQRQSSPNMVQTFCLSPQVIVLPLQSKKGILK